MNDKADEKIVYCQIDAHLDTNPKVRKAGRDARDIFEFLLRRVAIGRTEGTVPLKYIEPWYLADILMMTEDEARHGTSRAVTVTLICIDETAGVVRIVGWSPEWGRRPKNGAERMAAWRAKTGKPAEQQDHGRLSDEKSSRVTGGDESDVGEERRGEENKSPDALDVSLSRLLAVSIISHSPKHSLTRLSDTEKTKRLNKWADHVRLMREVDGHSETEIAAVIRWCQSSPFWRGNIQSTEKLREKWDSLIAQMERNGKKPTQRQPEQPTLTFRIGDVEVER